MFICLPKDTFFLSFPASNWNECVTCPTLSDFVHTAWSLWCSRHKFVHSHSIWRNFLWIFGADAFYRSCLEQLSSFFLSFRAPKIFLFPLWFWLEKSDQVLCQTGLHTFQLWATFQSALFPNPTLQSLQWCTLTPASIFWIVVATTTRWFVTRVEASPT